MNDIPAIRIQNLCKIYKLFHFPIDRIRETFDPFRRKYHKRFQALSDVSFDIERGEFVGIIGRNGSGKSTLLQLICGILHPTSGSIEANGRIAALLELGAGFNPEFTGRENAYLNGSILGLSRREMDDCIVDIIDFADIGEFIDQPVKMYSSGMYVRLAFAVAIHVHPEILIVDEALSVGDTLFQAKCFAKFREFQQKGITIIFVTHSIDLIVRFCDKACLLDKGFLKAHGKPQDVIDQYNKLLLHYSQPGEQTEPIQIRPESFKEQLLPGTIKFQLNPGENRYGNGSVTILDVGIFTLDGQPTQALKQMEEYAFQLIIYFHAQIQDPIFSYRVRNTQGVDITGTNTLYNHVETGVFEPGQKLHIAFTHKISLAGGEYLLSFGCAGFENGKYVVYERRYNVLTFKVAARYPSIGIVDLDSKITIKKGIDVSA